MKLLTIIMYHDIVNQNDDIYDKFDMLHYKKFSVDIRLPF